jgi:hypothetical protein
MMVGESHGLLAQLNVADLETLTVAKMEGFTNEEIANRILLLSTAPENTLSFLGGNDATSISKVGA